MSVLKKIAKEYPYTLLTTLGTILISSILFSWYRVFYESFLKKIPQELVIRTLIVLGALLIIALAYLYDLRKKSKKVDAFSKENEKIKAELLSLQTESDYENLPSDIIELLCCIAANERPLSNLREKSIFHVINKEFLAESINISQQKIKLYLSDLENRGLLNIDRRGRLFGLSDSGRKFLHKIGRLH